MTPNLPDTPFTCTEAYSLGLSKRHLHERVRAGEVRRIVRGVYLRADVPESLEVRAAAVSLVVSDHHVLVDRTAAWLHGVDVLTRSEHGVPPPLEACALRTRNPTHKSGVDGRSRDLGAADIMVMYGLRVTTPVRTALDLACNLRRREAYAALNEFAARVDVTAERLTPQLGRFRGRRGVRQARTLVALIDARMESQRESWTYLEIADHGLPLPTPQFWVEVDGIPTYRLDFAYPWQKVYVEYDGEEDHLRTPEQREHDRRRRAWLADHGWTGIVLRAGDFTGDRLDAWIRRLRDALRPAYSNRRW